METPGQSGRRLLAALEALVAQEAAAVHEGDFAALGELQDRCGEIGERLANLAGYPEVAALRDAVEAVVDRRRQSQRLLGQRLAAGRVELDRLRVARQRLGQLAQGYGAGASTSTRLNAAA